MSRKTCSGLQEGALQTPPELARGYRSSAFEGEGGGLEAGGLWENKKDKWDGNTPDQEGLRRWMQRWNRLHQAERESGRAGTGFHLRGDSPGPPN